MALVRFRRKNTAWLTVMGLIIAFALLAGSATPPVQISLLALFALATLASTVEFGQERETILDALRRAPLRQRMSPQAREAADRAKSQGGYSSNSLLMMDIGVIAAQSSYEGMAMRRTRTISKDDDGARPFITLNVEPEEGDRNAVLRFEITDQFGETVYVHEMKAYLRDGEMSIMADHHLPLAGNTSIQGTGDWDLRVFLDGNLVGIHNFTLAPSINERSRRLAGEYDNETEADTIFDIVDEVQQSANAKPAAAARPVQRQEIPPSLQDLLNQQQQQRSGSSNERRAPTSTRRRR
jgi:hypothetical protein